MHIKPTSNSSFEFTQEYYLSTISINKKSHQTEIYRMRPLQKFFGVKRLDEISPVDVVEYRDKRLAAPHPKIKEKTLEGATVKLELMLLSHVFNTAISEWGCSDLTNPVQNIRKPKVNPGRVRRLSKAEEKRLLKIAYNYRNPEIYAIVVLALETAMRQGEILSIVWENVNWDKKTVLLPTTKNGEARTVPLSLKAYGIFREYLDRKQNGKVFTYSSSGLKSTWRELIKKSGLVDFHFHDLRHSAISSLLERGLNTIEVATISGHKSMSMLKRYAHLQSYNLVDKLDPRRTSKKEAKLLKTNFQPYPAIITRYSKKIIIDFPDFHDLTIADRDENKAMEKAKNALLRKIAISICVGSELPLPTSCDSIVLPTSRYDMKIERINPL